VSGARYIVTRDVPLADLERYPGNARRGRVAEIRESLERNGQYRSLVVRQHDGRLTILAGNHTAEALEAEGGEVARCELVECDDDTARRVNLADNKIAEDGTYDDDALVALLGGLGGDYGGTGWTAKEYAALLGDDDDGGGDAPEDDLPSTFGVIVECDTEQQQARLLEQLDAEGFKVRAMIT
jgi:hypothetical protein